MIIEKLEKELLAIFKSCNLEVESLTVTKSNRPDLADYQCNDIFKISKTLGKSPLEIGQILEEEFKKLDKKIFEKIEFVKPGFINMSLSSSFINVNLEQINNQPKFGLKPVDEETFIIDYGGPNVAKPLHVGHMRTAIVGESIKRIIKFRGHKIISDIHLGDYGLQIGQVIYGLQKENINIDDIDITVLNRLYPQISALCKENEEVKETCAKITKDLQDGDAKYQELWQKILAVSVQDMKSYMLI